MAGKFNCKNFKFLGAILAGLGVILLITLIPMWVWWMLIAGTLVCFGCCFFIR